MIKSHIAQWLGADEDRHTERKGIPFLERVVMALIILNILAVIIESSFSSPNILRGFRLFETFSVIVFTIEYLLRLWVSDLIRSEIKPWRARLKFTFSAMAMIDLLAILPFYLPFLFAIDLRILRILRLLRLTRILKINRYTKALSVVIKVIRNKKEQLLSSLFIALMLLVTSSVLMYSAESVAQPDVFYSVIHTMWWSVATLTTVGYGDIYPITSIGKLLASFIAILGIGIVAIPTGIIAAGFTEVIGQNGEDQEQPVKSFCPYCGNNVEGDRNDG